MPRVKTKRLPIVGSAEIQYMLGVSQQRTFQLLNQPGFPEPWVRLRGGKVWHTEDFEAWAAEEGRSLTPLPADWPPERPPVTARPRGDAARRPRKVQ
jgi:hypothetical protein